MPIYGGDIVTGLGDPKLKALINSHPLKPLFDIRYVFSIDFADIESVAAATGDNLHHLGSNSNDLQQIAVIVRATQRTPSPRTPRHRG